MSDLTIAVIGAGNISTRYLQNAPLFRGVKIAAVADIVPEAAARQSQRFGVRALSVDEALASDEIQAVINLTVPNAHFAVSMAALSAGKHVFSEKPLTVSVEDGRRLVQEADARGLALSVAPDTFLGPGAQTARRLLEEGKVGRIVAGTATVMSRGMEHWHPNPTFFFKPGGGPVLDLGPYYITTLVAMLGPVRRVVAMTKIGLPERLVTAEGPMKGEKILVETATTAFAVLEFASGVVVSFDASWDVFKHAHKPIELHGTEGSLRVPDPNFFGGLVEYSEGRGDWVGIDTRMEVCGKPNHPDADPLHANYRMLGVAEFAAAIRAGRPPRTSGRLGLHVLEVMYAILEAGETGRQIAIEGGERPAALGEAELRSLLVDPLATAGTAAAAAA
ncbi:Gfo/Idh/MocA family protein [Prosthecomicrobium sp. N25]|uniref:Gfo/Idh/MocA family protein n=1 Tax=Prosthecomicrobium sp. N25 TaxID=3129254 RepID=UPI003076E2FF